MAELALLLAAGFVAGGVNAIAGGGPLITVAALMLLGIDAKIANLTSTVALSPGQFLSGWQVRRRIAPLPAPLPGVVAINLAGGAAGAVLLLLTPSEAFLRLVPWLVLFATGVYFVSSLRGPPAPPTDAPASPAPFLGLQLILSIYGGYFGGGNSFMMLALLAASGLDTRAAGRAKNLLISLINLAAVAVFLAIGPVDLRTVLPVAAGGVAGSLVGIWLLERIDLRWLRALVIALGLALAAWLFARG